MLDLLAWDEKLNVITFEKVLERSKMIAFVVRVDEDVSAFQVDFRFPSTELAENLLSAPYRYELSRHLRDLLSFRVCALLRHRYYTIAVNSCQGGEGLRHRDIRHLPVVIFVPPQSS
jgi:hypothetical protein